MKVFLLMLLFVGCASDKNHQIIKESQNLPVKSIEQKKADIKEMVSEHSELDRNKREKVEKILISSVDRTDKLRKRESQLIQQITNYTIVQKGTHKQLSVLKSELNDLYKEKYKNYEVAIGQLKDVLGLKPENQQLIQDRRMDIFFERD